MYRFLSKNPAPPSQTLQLNEASPSLLLDEALGRLLDLVLDVLDVPAALIWFFDATQKPRLKATRGLDPTFIPCASPFCAALAATNTMLEVNDVAAHPTFHADPLLTAAHARFGAGVPLHLADHTLGGLVILDTQPRMLSSEHQQTLHHLARLATDAWSLSEQGHAEREARYRAYFEKSTEGIWCYELVPPVPIALPVEEFLHLAYERACLTECNDAMARMYGYESAAQLATDDLNRLLPPNAPGNFNAVKAFIEGSYKATEVETVEYDRFNTPRYFLNNIVGIIEDDHLVRVWGSQTDITRHREAEEALRSNEQLLTSINQNISEGIYRSTPDGQLLYANDALAHLFGFASAREIMNVQVPSLYKDPERRAELARLTRQEHGFKNEEVELVRQDGSTFWGLISCNATFDDDGNVVTYDGAISDITQRKQYEKGLIEAKEQALELARIKSAFLANMSHEIRTPLMAIVGFADILAKESGESHQELTQLLRQSGQHLIQTLKSVLDLTRLEGQSLELNIERFDVARLARQVLDLFRLQAEQRDLDLKLVTPETPLFVNMDAGAVNRILTNLVSNAMKFTSVGGVTVTLENQDDALNIRVADTGSGISKEFLPRLFSEFRQESGTLAPEQKGSGLGLAITKRLVTLLDGTITVESEKGQGSIFTVRLPHTAATDER